MKFDFKYSKSSIQFLDTIIYENNDNKNLQRKQQRQQQQC